MKKLIISSLTFLLFIGCSSSSIKTNTIQMESIKWVLPYSEGFCEEADIIKQMNMFELVPGPQKFSVETLKKPGKTIYFLDMFLNVRLKHRVDINIDEILSGDIGIAKMAANIKIYLLDRNGERIPTERFFGPLDLYLILFNDRDFCTEWFIDYLTFLQSEPGTEFQLHAWSDFCEPEDRCKIGFSNLIKEVKGVELQMDGVDDGFERYIGFIECDSGDCPLQISIQFDYDAETYPEDNKEMIDICLDTENQVFYYFDQSGEKVFLDKYPDMTIEEKWDAELEKANLQLEKDLANHEYDWLYGTWLDFNDQLVVIDKDYVYVNGTKEPFRLHYELEDPYSETLDYGLYLYLCDIKVEPRMHGLYWADEFGFYDYQRVSNSTDPVTKVYSNAYDGFVNVRERPDNSAPILGVLRNGPEGAILLGTEGDWKKVNCNGIVGYVHGLYLLDTPTEVFRSEALLNLLGKHPGTYRFSESDLSALSAKDLTYLRNSVYAKHGFVFNSQELNSYFKQFTWYRPNSSVTESVLNSVEKANVELIKSYQSRTGKTYLPR